MSRRRTLTPMEARRPAFEAAYMPEPNSGCWLWYDLACNPFGYGVFRYLDRRHRYAHRYSWELHHGPIPDGLFVLHKCDTPACVNPDHLFLGTQADNVADKIVKGRDKPPPIKDWPAIMRSRPHHWQKLTREQVVEIRTRLAAGEFQRVIAADYGVRQTAISRIATGKRWAHMP